MKTKRALLLTVMLFVLTACKTDSQNNEPVKEAADILGEYTKGTLTEDSWESEWLGMRFTAPEGMAMATQEELDELMGFTTEAVSGDFSESQLENAEMSTVHEMFCMADDLMSHVTVVVEKLAVQQDMDSYIKVMEDTLSKVSSMEYSVTSSDGVVQVGGREFREVKCTATYRGFEIYQSYLLIMVDDRVISINSTYLDEETYETLLSGFEVY